MLGYTIEDSIDRLEKRVKKVEESGGGGGASTWNQLTGKPFNTVDSDTLSTDSNQLAVKAVPDDKIILSSGFEMPTLSEELTYLENEVITLDQDVEGIYQLLNYYADNGFLSYNLHYFSMEDAKATNPDATWSGNTAVYRGVTFTFNEDGSIGIEGTATGSINFFFLRRTGSNKLNIPAGNYYLSGCDDGSNTTYRLGITKTVGSSSVVVATQTDSPVEFNYTNEEVPYGYFIGVSSGATVNTVIRPMIRPVAITSSEYVPYAPSNIELSKRESGSGPSYDVLHIPTTSGCEVVSGGYVEMGQMVIVAVRVQTTQNAASKIIIPPSAIPSNHFGGAAYNSNSNNLVYWYYNAAENCISFSAPTGHNVLFNLTYFI